MLDSALENLFQSFSSEKLYPSIQAKAARLSYGLVKNHAMIEGKHSIGQMIIKSKYQAKLKTKELDIFLFQIFFLI